MRGPNTDATKHKEIPFYNPETWFYEDFAIGQRVRSIRRTISEGESMAFNALVMDIHPYVADDVFASEEGVFGTRIVAGAFVFSLGLGLVANNCVTAFSYGYDKLRFIRPVFIEDTIYTIRTNLNKKPRTDTISLVRASYCTRSSSTRVSSCCIASICRPHDIVIRCHFWIRSRRSERVKEHRAVSRLKRMANSRPGPLAHVGRNSDG
jgi:acyl dehydratase